MSATKTRRIRRLVVGGAAVVLLGSAGAGVAQAAGFLSLTPDEGAPGTPYKVTITCDEKPTLYGQPLDDSPAGTLVPLTIAPDGATQWTFDATAGDYDDQYGVSCGDVTEQARFDADAPWLYLGPIAENISGLFQPKTEVGGSDCPAGTTASVSITRNGVTSTHTAAIDERGDWSVPLDTPYVTQGATESLRAEATCGSVIYTPLVLTAQVTPTTPTEPTTPTTPTSAGSTPPPPAAAAPAKARPANASYTG